MSRMEDFGNCLSNRDLGQLRGFADCLYQLHEAMANETAALAVHSEEQNALLLRKCDLCGENLNRHAVWELLLVVEQIIAKRESKDEVND